MKLEIWATCLNLVTCKTSSKKLVKTLVLDGQLNDGKKLLLMEKEVRRHAEEAEAELYKINIRELWYRNWNKYPDLVFMFFYKEV